MPAYLAALDLISLLSMYLASETYRSDLSGQATVAERQVATSESRSTVQTLVTGGSVSSVGERGRPARRIYPTGR